MVDVASGFGIDQRHAGLAIKMTREIGELIREDFEDCRVDLNSADSLGAEIEARKNVTTAAHAHDSDVRRRLHQVCGIDHVVLEVGELADVTVIFGDRRSRIGVDIEVMLLYFGIWFAGETPPERGVPEGSHPDARIGIPALEQRACLLISLGPDHAEMALAGHGKTSMHDGHSGQRERNGPAQAQAVNLVTVSQYCPAGRGGEGADPKRGTDGIDYQQYEDDAEASDRSSQQISCIKQSAAIRQAR